MSEEKGLVVVETEGGPVTLSQTIVRRYLVNGNGAVTDQEVQMFIGLCKFQKLNPFLREAYLIKYGSQPATIVVGKEAFLKRAMHIKDCTGFRAGVICQGKDGETKHTDGYCPPDMKLVGGWAEVSKLNWAYPLRLEVSLQEYLGRKNDGTPNRMWSEKPATMIRKVALVQALRESFPDQFGGMYSQEEINKVEDLPTDPIDVSPPPYMEPKVQRERKKASEKPPEPPPPIFRPCPNRDGRNVSVDDCDQCDHREGCPEVGTI